jgi:hypothetical protein
MIKFKVGEGSRMDENQPRKQMALLTKMLQESLLVKRKK